MRKMDSSRSISSTMASRRASRKVISRRSGIHVLEDGVGRRDRRLLRELDGVLHLRLRLVVERPQLRLGRDAEGLDTLPQDTDRVALHPPFHLLLAAILGGIGHRVTAEAVGLRLEEERQALLAGSADRV